MVSCLMRPLGLVVWKCHLHFHQIVIIRVNAPTRAVRASQRCKKDLQPADHQGTIRRKHLWGEHTAGEKQPGTRDVTAELQSLIGVNPDYRGCLTISVFITSTFPEQLPKLTFLLLSLPIKQPMMDLNHICSFICLLHLSVSTWGVFQQC